MQGFSRTYFNQNWTLDYPRLMDTNFEDYGIRLWYQKNKKNETKKIQNKKPLYKINIVLALEKF